MTLLAHWKLNDGVGTVPTVAADSAGGGSGDHDGVYTLGASEGSGCLLLGGIGGRHLYSTYQQGYVTTFNNITDLNSIHGSLTLMFWYHRNEGLGWQNGGTSRTPNCMTSSWSTEADNIPWLTQINATGYPGFSWQYGSSGTTTGTQSCSQAVDLAGWTHITVKRYEISAGYYGIKFYFDGVLVDTIDNGGAGWPAHTGGANCQAFIGRDANNLNPYYCHWFCDSVRLYDEELSDEDIEDVYEAEAAEMYAETVEEGIFGTNDYCGFSEGIF